MVPEFGTLRAEQASMVPEIGLMCLQGCTSGCAEKMSGMRRHRPQRLGRMVRVHPLQWSEEAKVCTREPPHDYGYVDSGGQVNVK